MLAATNAVRKPYEIFLKAWSDLEQWLAVRRLEAMYSTLCHMDMPVSDRWDWEITLHTCPLMPDEVDALECIAKTLNLKYKG